MTDQEALVAMRQEREELAMLLNAPGWKHVQRAAAEQAKALLVKAVAAKDVHEQTKALAMHAMASDMANYVLNRIEELGQMIQASEPLVSRGLNR